MVVEAVTPVADAVQVLVALVAVNGSDPDVLIPAMLVELVTDPLGPVVPWVLALSWLEEKSVAGATVPAVPSGSAWVTLPPVVGSSTDGLEEAAGVGAQPGGVLGAVQATWPTRGG